MGDNKIKNIAISGASGFIGTHLSEYFRKQGITIYPLARHHFTDSGRDELDSFVGRSDAVINLAGAPINHRWTGEYKKVMYESRINTTRRLVESIKAVADKPKVFCSASAVGYYPQEGCYSEDNAVKGDGFLSDLCEEWEGEALKASAIVRTAVTRFGLVLSPDGGVLRIMQVPTLFKFATMLGNGNQYFPWIDIQDLCRAMEFIMRDDGLDGVFNFTAPEVVTNAEFTRALVSAQRSWFTVKAPRWVFRAALGEASSFVLSGQCAVPQKLELAGYRFISPDIRTFFCST